MLNEGIKTKSGFFIINMKRTVTLSIIGGLAISIIVIALVSNYYATKDLLPEIEQNDLRCWTVWKIKHDGNPYEDGSISNSIRETISGFGPHVDDPFRNIKITKNTDGTFNVMVSGIWKDDERNAITSTLDEIEKISLTNTEDVIRTMCS